MTNRHFCHDKDTARSGVKKVLMIIGFTILGIGLFVLMGFIVMWLWNWLMPMIFNLPALNYWQAVGIFIFSKIIFGGFSGGGGNDSGHRGPRKARKKASGIEGEFEVNGFGKSIRREFKKEFDKKFDKEFDKEWDKEFSSEEDTNEDYDELYEKWWEEKGEYSFKEYMKNSRHEEDADE